MSTLDTLQSAGTADLSTETGRRVAALGPWFHNLHLSNIQTAPDHPLGDFPAFKWAEIAPHIPADLTGWRALDIGCNAGFYTFELARRGAEVVGLELDAHYLAQARWAAGELGLAERVEFRQGSVYDLAQTDEAFDLVLFMGVFYHLRYPTLALDLVAERTRRMLVFQTLTAPGDEVVEAPQDLGIHERGALRQPGWPAMAFIEHRLAGDPTNWWAPTHACCGALLRAAGMQVDARPGHEIYLCSPAAASRSGGAGPDRQSRAAELRAATGR